MIGPLFLAILFWVVYFFIIFFVCQWLYRRLSGPEPGPETPSMIIQGRSIPAKVVWENRAKRLQRIVIILAVVLMALPLLLPFVLPLHQLQE
jgi:hypothetical protein